MREISPYILIGCIVVIILALYYFASKTEKMVVARELSVGAPAAPAWRHGGSADDILWPLDKHDMAGALPAGLAVSDAPVQAGRPQNDEDYYDPVTQAIRVGGVGPRPAMFVPDELEKEN